MCEMYIELYMSLQSRYIFFHVQTYAHMCHGGMHVDVWVWVLHWRMCNLLYQVSVTGEHLIYSINKFYTS